MLVSAITASNASLFPEYILPNVRYIGRDSEVMVRAMYAQCLVPLAETSIRFLEMSQAIKAHGTVKSRGTHDFDAIFEDVGLYVTHARARPDLYKIGLIRHKTPRYSIGD